MLRVANEHAIARARDDDLQGGTRGIRVRLISTGPLKGRAAPGLKDIDLLLAQAAQKVAAGGAAPRSPG